MPDGSFLRHLPTDVWQLLVRDWGSDARVHQRGEKLPLGRDDRHVYIVLGGCVLQERFPLGTKIARFRGVGQLLGEAKLIDPEASVGTVCLTTTWIMPCPVPRMNVLLNQHLDARLALLRSLEHRNRSDEMIYGTATRTPIQRVGGLLLHLAAVSGTRSTAEPDHHTILGPTQRDIADALLMGMSTVENALRALRDTHNVITSTYRQFVVTDLPSLRRIVTAS
ncbi:winged helix-turn-helix domain-containing protein [Streptomyces phaeolivaceus]|uniref:Winged helix-turn-helix domain-containing protein n=2 Tax=Streptomyces phaeolivaceus TaxID=2653200 RepID=A0A5P8KIR8_9ACTN|nr:winged helix-turn-helix domain-containing protein [Streptomyces phaeolivaceus]